MGGRESSEKLSHLQAARTSCPKILRSFTGSMPCGGDSVQRF